VQLLELGLFIGIEGLGPLGAQHLTTVGAQFGQHRHPGMQLVLLELVAGLVSTHIHVLVVQAHDLAGQGLAQFALCLVGHEHSDGFGGNLANGQQVILESAAQAGTGLQGLATGAPVAMGLGTLEGALLEQALPHLAGGHERRLRAVRPTRCPVGSTHARADHGPATRPGGMAIPQRLSLS